MTTRRTVRVEILIDGLRFGQAEVKSDDRTVEDLAAQAVPEALHNARQRVVTERDKALERAAAFANIDGVRLEDSK